MSEHDDRYARPDLPSTTAEFRATPDASASTAEFKAFAAGNDTAAQRVQPADVWPEQPWAGEQPKRGGRTAAIAIGAVVAIAVVVTLLIAFG
jgi:hypothetical protein